MDEAVILALLKNPELAQKILDWATSEKGKAWLAQNAKGDSDETRPEDQPEAN